MDLQSIINQIQAPAFLAAIGFVAKYAHDMSKSIDKLNINIATVVLKSENQEHLLSDHENRLRLLEREEITRR